MRFLGFLAHANSLLNTNFNYLNGNSKTWLSVAKNKMSTPKGIESGNNELFKLVPISKEEADKLKCDNEIISYEYIKVSIEKSL